MTDFPVQAHSMSLKNQLARGDPLSVSGVAKERRVGCSRADFQVPNALDKTRDIYINAVVLSRLKTNFRAKAGVLCRCIRCRAARPRAQGASGPQKNPPLGHRPDLHRLAARAGECRPTGRSVRIWHAQFMSRTSCERLPATC